MPELNAFVRDILSKPLSVVANGTDPAAWAPRPSHSQALLQDLVLRYGLRSNVSVVRQLQPLADAFMASGTLPPPDLLQARHAYSWAVFGAKCAAIFSAVPPFPPLPSDAYGLPLSQPAHPTLLLLRRARSIWRFQPWRRPPLTLFSPATRAARCRPSSGRACLRWRLHRRMR